VKNATIVSTGETFSIVKFEPPAGFYTLVYVVCIVKGKENNPTLIRAKKGETTVTCSYLDPGSDIIIAMAAAKDDEVSDDVVYLSAKTSIIQFILKLSESTKQHFSIFRFE
jgi:hypothetical protein